MTLTNVTFGFFNDVCSRHDVAIEVSQDNDDGQHPITASQLAYYNSSVANKIFNGRPNLDVVDPSDCVGKKKKFIDFIHLIEIEFIPRYGL
jgi:hypothetical protein